MENTIIDFCEENDIEFISTEIVDKHRKVTFIATECGHEKTVLWINLKKLSGVKTCSLCYEHAELTYDKLIELFESNNCKVLTSREEFENFNAQKDKILYIGQCGHEILINLHHFKSDGQGRKCKPCLNLESRENSINIRKNDKMYCQRIEAEGNEIFTNILKDSFIIKRTFEGCIVDIYIKPNNIEDDLWLPIQMKATAGKASQNRYMFMTDSSNYSDLVLCCISNEDHRFWIFDNFEHPNVNIGISKANEKSKSKYDIFEVNKNNLIEKFKELYKSQKLITKKEAMTPSNKSACKEIEYRLIREEKIDYLSFEYPEIQCQNYDFIINNLKVQEKVLFSDDGQKGLTANLAKTLGKKINKTFKKGPYEQDDNDFYWYHVQDSSKFYILPQQVLIDDGYIKSEKFPGKTKMLLYPMCSLEEAIKLKYKTAEYNKYLFSYDNIENINKIKNLFKI
jgi:hypothetical protein